MENVAIIIQARTGSGRLPNKVILPFYNNMCLLEIIIERLKKTSLNIFVATSNSTFDDVIEEISLRSEVYCYRQDGDENNVLSRFKSISENHNLTHAIRVCSDNPFIGLNLLNKCISYLYKNNDADYIGYFDNSDIPSIRSHFGFFSEIISYNAMKKITQLAKDDYHFEHVTSYIYDNPDIFKIKKLKLPNILNTNNIRLTVDSYSDFNLTSKIFSNYKGDLDSFDELIHYIQSDNELIEEMSLNIKTNKK